MLPFSPPRWWLPLVAFAALSDWLDGFLARRLGAQSWIGGILDGSTDKLFVVTALVTFQVHGLIAWWQIPFLLLRELPVVLGVALAAARRDREGFRSMSSRPLGKLVTVALFAFLLSLLALPETRGLHGVLYSIAVILSAAAAADYVFAWYRHFLRAQETA